MKVDEIRSAISDYKRFLRSKNRLSYIYLFEVTENLNASFRSGDDYLQIIETGLKSSMTQRLWYRERYEPKKNLLTLADHAPEYFQRAMQDLLNEDKELENRIDRFKFYCDELLKTYKSDNKHSTLNHHYIDESFISLLLMGKYPEIYAYYDFGLFKSIAEKTAAKPIPTVNDYPRYQKFIQVFSTFIRKDNELLELINKRSPEHSQMANISVECMAMSCNIDLTV